VGSLGTGHAKDDSERKHLALSVWQTGDGRPQFCVEWEFWFRLPIGSGNFVQCQSVSTLLTEAVDVDIDSRAYHPRLRARVVFDDVPSLQCA
jgi:hypothetical protein